MFGDFTGGIIGSNYSDSLFKMAASTKGALMYHIKTMSNIIPDVEVVYTQDNIAITNFDNLKLSADTME